MAGCGGVAVSGRAAGTGSQARLQDRQAVLRDHLRGGGVHRAGERGAAGADHRHQRRLGSRQPRGRAQGQGGYRLFGAAGVAHQGDRRIRRAAVRQHALRHLGQAAGGHVVHQRIRLRHGDLAGVAGAQRHRGSAPAPGQRQFGVGGGAGGRGDAGHDFVPNAGGAQELDLLGTAPEQQRVAALQMRHPPPGACLFGEHGVQPALPFGGRGTAVAEAVHRAAGAGNQQAAIHQVVVDHHVGGGQGALAAHGDQLRIARPRPDQADERRHQPGRAAAPAVNRAITGSTRGPPRARAAGGTPRRLPCPAAYSGRARGRH